jgi:dolichol-phosphate mannosyltransferase
MKSDTVIVIPTYNEASNLVELIARIDAALPDSLVLIVDDDSPDGTAARAESAEVMSGRRVQLRVLRRTGPRGLGRAYREGFVWALNAGARFVLQMDADLSHDPADLPRLLQATRAGAGLSVGSRYCPGGALRDWPIHRRLLSRIAGRYVQAIAGVRIADPTAGFRCWNVDALRRVDLASIRSEGYSFQVEMTYRAERTGTSIVEVPITFVDRTRGNSKISRKVIWESILMPWRFRLNPWHAPVPTIDSAEVKHG